MKHLSLMLIVATTAMGFAAPGLTAPFDNAKSEHWGVVVRNTIGSPVAELRNGPSAKIISSGQLTDPPYGKGSLGIEVADKSTSSGTPSEKIDFGNEVDYYGDPVLALTEVGFYVFQTGENASVNPRNVPVIRLEIDANLNALPGDNYTTMVWVPDPIATIDKWSAYIDATTNGNWYFTGAEGGATGCTDSLNCTFTQAITALNDGGPVPTVYSVAVGKGRDNLWVGAIDGLRLNNRIIDFEADGVKNKGVGDKN